MDVRGDQDQFVVELDVPGVCPGSIDVSIDGSSTLTVSAECRTPVAVPTGRTGWSPAAS